MRALFGAALLAFATPVAAQILPATYSVTGVAADDVLNVRAAPDAAAAAIAGLSYDASGIEVVALSADGKWAQVNVDEAAGWAALRFLAREPGPDWTALQSPLECHGTEPFWSLSLNPSGNGAYYELAGNEGFVAAVVWSAAATNGSPVAGFRLDHAEFDGFATVTAGSCSDGMSDRMMGLSVGLFLTTPKGEVGYSGCCTLAP